MNQNFEFINALKDLGPEFYAVQKPARYIGGESGCVPPIESRDARLRIALSFPDLYEIGMSNNAIRILYSMLNEHRDLLIGERVFAPAPDFEELLIKKVYLSIH